MLPQFQTPILVTGTFTPGGTQDVNIVSSITLNIAAASLPLPTGAATEATLLAVKLDLDKFTFTSTRLLVDGSGVVQPISGSVSVSNFPAVQPVSQSGSWTVSLASESIEIGTVDQGTGGASPWLVTGPLTDTQLRASAVAISGTVAATQSGTWNITNISGTVSLPTGAATAAKQPALGTAGTASADVITVQGIASMTALKVDGSATTQPISGSVSVSNFPATQPISAVSLPLPTGASTAAKQPALGTAGTPSADVLTIQGVTSMTPLKVDGSATTQPVSGTVTANAGTGTFTVGQATGTNLHTVVDSGTITAVTAITNALPAGTNVIGHVITDSGSTTVITSNVTVVQPTGTNLHTTVDNFPATQPISGTVTANAGTNLNTSALLLDATFTARINTQGQKTMAASTPVVIASDQSAIPISGSITISNVAGTLDNGAETAVAGSAVQVLAANSNRRKLIIQNTGSANVRVGTTGVTTTTGFRLTVGATILFDSPECPTNAIFSIREGAVSSTVFAQEVV